VGGGQGLRSCGEEGGAVRVPRQPHWFEPVADHLGAAYLRYSFTKGTEQEVDFLVDALGLQRGMTVLDVGCGPGRHVHAMASRGLRVIGVDISFRFLQVGASSSAEVGRPSVFAQADARVLPVASSSVDAAVSLCQGAFGLLGGPGSKLDEDAVVLAEMARVLRPGGRLAVSAFSAYFQMRYIEQTDTFDAERGVNHEHTEVRDEQGRAAPAELWTSCFTPRELRMLASGAGLTATKVWGVTPGNYGAGKPDIDQPEFLLVAERPAGAGRSSGAN
jgi:SAM-dependent methyltransferase